jgi:hypothetical protein
MKIRAVLLALVASSLTFVPLPAVPQSSTGLFQQSGTGAGPRTYQSKMRDVISVMDFQAAQPSVPIGTGGDDYPALQAAINACVKGGSPFGCEVFLPRSPTGYYNICGTTHFLDIHSPVSGDPTWSLIIRGSGSGGGSTIRVQPGCANPPSRMINIDVFATNDPKSSGRVRLTDLRVDGYGLADVNLYVNYAVGCQIDNSVFRNVKAGANNANIKVMAGYECKFEASTRVENVNDPGHVMYNSTADLPDYNVYTIGNDSIFAVKSALDAKIANFYQGHGGNNTFIGAHGWGYTGAGDGQPDLRPQYNFYLRGKATVIGSFADSATLAGIYLTPTLDSGGPDTSGSIVVGNTMYVFGGAGSPAFVRLGAGSQNNVITGNNPGGYPIVFDDASPNTTNILRDNAGSNLSSRLLVQGYKGTEQQLIITNDSGNSYVAAVAPTGVGSDASVLKFSANGSGVIQSSVNGVVGETISSSGVRSHLPHTFGIPGTSLGQAIFSGNTSGSTTLQSAAIASGNITLPAATDTLVGRATTDTLTNKTLISPIIATISNGGAITLPSATDTLVGRATADTFTNKTFDTAATGNVLRVNGTAISAVSGTGSLALTNNPTFGGTVSVNAISGFGPIATSNSLKSGALAVASLPSCSLAAEGTRYGVTDATATTFLSIVAGGGTNRVPVYCNGTNWVIGG